jgi:hypothetical protein
MGRVCLIVLVLALLAGTGGVLGQDDEREPHPLLAMLALVPDSEHARSAGGWATVRYADYQALYITEGIDELRLRADIETLLESVPLPGMLSRIQAGPEALQYVVMNAEQMPGIVGFEWFANVNRSLEYGSPPHSALILDGTFDDSAIGAALSARGFEQADVGGLPVWHRFEDGAISIEDREPSDPFGGHLGMAARIGVLPGYLANSRYWDLTQDIIATAQGEQPSLAEDPTYRALAEAITAPEGLLVQALFFNVADVGFLPEEALDALTHQTAESATESYGALPPYAMAVLADLQESENQVHLIALVYPNPTSAQIAGDEIANRISAFSLPQQPGEVLVERFGAQVTSRVYESETTGKSVAIVEARYPLPAERIDPETGFFITGGLMYRAWVNALVQRAFYVLVVKAE